MSAQTIYIKLVQSGMSPVGACAMMGNMKAESAMRADNVQDGYGYTDEDYTAKVDAGQLEFRDGIGYGLCQWTYSTRKRNLLDFARSRGVSVGNEDMQVDFCIKELQTEYASLWRYLTTATGVYEAADRICREYERPAVNNVDVRAGFANEFYMSLGGLDVSQPSSPDNSPTGEPGDEIFHTPAVEILWPPRELAFGMFGGDVVALQGLLVARGFNLNVDGDFGNKTRMALMAFQAESGLVGDGVAGNLTWAALLKR